jgi:tetratricopeptide (TPR) repeat protein
MWASSGFDPKPTVRQINATPAITLSSTWGDAYFMKAYALQDLGRVTHAKSTVQLALELSPLNSRYLSELGSIYAREKNWAKAQEVFEKTEDNASLSADDSRAEALGQARRGQGYVLVELGQLDEGREKVSAVPGDRSAGHQGGKRTGVCPRFASQDKIALIFVRLISFRQQRDDAPEAGRRESLWHHAC